MLAQMLHFLPPMTPRARLTVLLFAAFISVLACRDRNDDSGAKVSDSFLEAGEEAEAALARPVDFRLTESILGRWERAQANLDRLSRNDIQRSSDGGAEDPVERAINRLRNNRRARRAIESAGISVRDFVLATIALAQAVQAADPGRRAPLAGVPPENVTFVITHRSRLAERSPPREWLTEGESAQVDLDARVADSIAAANPREGADEGFVAEPVAPIPVEGSPPVQPAPRPLPRPRTDTVSAPLPPVAPPPPTDSVRDSLAAAGIRRG